MFWYSAIVGSYCVLIVSKMICSQLVLAVANSQEIILPCIRQQETIRNWMAFCGFAIFALKLLYFSILTLYLFLFFFFQNYINESLKYLDKSYPNTSLAGLHTPMSDTKPIYIDTKALLGHHVDNNKNNTKWLWFRRKENTQKNITILLDHPKYQKNFGHLP